MELARRLNSGARRGTAGQIVGCLQAHDDDLAPVGETFGPACRAAGRFVGQPGRTLLASASLYREVLWILRVPKLIGQRNKLSVARYAIKPTCPPIRPSCLDSSLRTRHEVPPNIPLPDGVAADDHDVTVFCGYQLH